MTQTALITGINRGIGKGLADLLLERGYFVIGTCRDLSQVPPKDRLTIETLDIRDDDAILSFAKKYENRQIDLLINSAGVLYGQNQMSWGEDATSIGSFSRSGIRETIEVNTLSPLKVTEAFIPHLLKSNQKIIATISSSAGSINGNQTGGMIAYRMSKAALNMGMQEFNIKLKRQGIHVLLLHPGWVQTDMGGKNATLTVEESVLGLLNVIENKEKYPSGGFYDYQGNNLPF